MRRFACLTVLTAVALSGPAGSQTPSSLPNLDRAALIGTWRLVSIVTIRPNGEAITEWMGSQPTGMIAYLPSGYMSVQFMRDPRPRFAGTTWAGATATEKLAAIDGYYAYFGAYEIDVASRTVTHIVHASLRPNEVGLRYQRRFELAGDRLTLTSHTFQEAGEARFNRLVFERIK